MSNKNQVQTKQSPDRKGQPREHRNPIPAAAKEMAGYRVNLDGLEMALQRLSHQWRRIQSYVRWVCVKRLAHQKAEAIAKAERVGHRADEPTSRLQHSPDLDQRPVREAQMLHNLGENYHVE